MKEKTLINKKDIDELLANNIIDDDELNNISGGVIEITKTAEVRKVWHMTGPNNRQTVIADPKTGYEAGELL